MERSFEDASAQDGSSALRGLPRWARISAMVLGILGGGSGAWAAFVSSNQAGTAMLLIASLALLLIGLQGTPILRIGASEASVELADIQDRAIEAVEQVRDEQGPEAAQLVTETLTEIDDRLIRRSYGFREAREDYSRIVRNTLSRNGVQPIAWPSGTVDFVVKTQDDETIAVVTIYPNKHNPQWIKFWEQIKVISEFPGVRGILIVGNNLPGHYERRIRELVDDPSVVKAVRWDDIDGAAKLLDALNKIQESIRSADT